MRTQEPVREALDEKEAQRIAAALLGVPSGERPNWEKTPIPRTFNTPGPEEWPVANRYSLIRDRSTYAENLTQVQQALARLLLNQAEATAGCLPAPSARAEESHMVRVRALAMSRLGAAVTAAALVGLLVALDLEAPLLGAVAWAADHWEAGGEVWGNISERFGASLVLTAAGLGAFAVVFGVMSSAWVSWHQRESLRLCADPDGSRCTARLQWVPFRSCVPARVDPLVPVVVADRVRRDHSSRGLARVPARAGLPAVGTVVAVSWFAPPPPSRSRLT